MATFVVNGELRYSSSTRANNVLNDMQDVIDNHPEVIESSLTRFNPGIQRNSTTVTFSFEVPSREEAEALIADLVPQWSQYARVSGHVGTVRRGEE